MSKSFAACLLALAVALTTAGCSKEPPASATEAPAAPAASAPAMSPHGTPNAPHPVPAGPSEPVELSGIDKADGGKTIAEIFAGKDELAGQEVLFRGRVVKVNAGIMGKNWLHVRDGTGAEGANDLTVTTLNVLPDVGDTVLVSGQLEADKDFGMGYRYDLIIENADVTVEAPAPR